MIFAGDLMPGSMHLEADLAEQLGMSRTPVREAALTLQAQGLLQVRPRKGVVIASISCRRSRGRHCRVECGDYGDGYGTGRE